MVGQVSSFLPLASKDIWVALPWAPCACWGICLPFPSIQRVQMSSGLPFSLFFLFPLFSRASLSARLGGISWAEQFGSPWPCWNHARLSRNILFWLFLSSFFFTSTSAHSGGFLDRDIGGWLSHAALRTEKKNPFPFFSFFSLPRVGVMGPNHVALRCSIGATPLVQLQHSERHQEHLYQPLPPPPKRNKSPNHSCTSQIHAYTHTSSFLLLPPCPSLLYFLSYFFPKTYFLIFSTNSDHTPPQIQFN